MGQGTSLDITWLLWDIDWGLGILLDLSLSLGIRDDKNFVGSKSLCGCDYVQNWGWTIKLDLDSTLSKSLYFFIIIICILVKSTVSNFY